MAHVFGLYWESHYCGSFFVCNISSRYCHLNISNVTFTIYSEGGILMNIFAKRIKELRQNSGLSQKELSYILNIERTTLTGYETGRRMPDAEMICSIADYFHVTVDFLTRLFGGGFFRVKKDSHYAQREHMAILLYM